MTTPSGDQYAISAAGYEAVVTESGGALRSLTLHGRPLVDGFGEDEMSWAGRGQLLMPWPNRIEDGRYTFDGEARQLALTEPSRGHASHGLARWVAWTPEEHGGHAVTLGYRLMAQSGYPWTLDLHVTYDLSADGLTVTQSATNLSSQPAPYASGAHPYLVAGAAGPGAVDSWELTVHAATRTLSDDRLIPTDRVEVAGTAYDFSVGRPLGDLVLNDAFTDLGRDAHDTAEVRLHDPRSGHTTCLWGGPGIVWWQLYTADDRPADQARRALAVEPMTANANAFATGEDLLRLAAAGEPGDSFSVTWGIRAVEQEA